MLPLASINRLQGTGKSQTSRSGFPGRPASLLVRSIALFLAHSLALLTMALSILVWNAWRSPDQSVQFWLILALSCALCLNPFAALGVSAVLASPDAAINFARSLASRPTLRWLRRATLLIAAGIVSTVLLGSTAIFVILQLI